MSCRNCENLFDQDCEAEACKDERRRHRTAFFDYLACKELEKMEEWENDVDL